MLVRRLLFAGCRQEICNLLCSWWNNKMLILHILIFGEHFYEFSNNKNEIAFNKNLEDFVWFRFWHLQFVFSSKNFGVCDFHFLRLFALVILIENCSAFKPLFNFRENSFKYLFEKSTNFPTFHNGYEITHKTETFCDEFNVKQITFSFALNYAKSRA